jgi:hypothetical protein
VPTSGIAGHAGHDLHVIEEAVPAPRTRTITLEPGELEDFAAILREQLAYDSDLLEDMAAGHGSPLRVIARMTLAVRLLAATV